MKKRPSSKARAKPEKAELTRQGAKAAARGEDPPVNPLDAAENSPRSTGEPLSEWLVRREAWQAGYDEQSTTSLHARPPTSQGRDDEHD